MGRKITKYPNTFVIEDLQSACVDLAEIVALMTSESEAEGNQIFRDMIAKMDNRANKVNQENDKAQPITWETLKAVTIDNLKDFLDRLEGR